MDVAVSELRAHLSDYLDRARAGDEVVITDRGVPVRPAARPGPPPPRWSGWPPTGSSDAPRLLRAPGIRAAPPRPRRPVANLVSDQRRYRCRWSTSTPAPWSSCVVEESGSDLAAQLWDGCDAAVASRLAYPEESAPRSLAHGRAEPRPQPTTTWTPPSRHGSSTGPQYAQSSSPQPSNATPASWPAPCPARRRRRAPGQRPGPRRPRPHHRRLGPAAVRRRRQRRTTSCPGTPSRHVTCRHHHSRRRTPNQRTPPASARP